MGSDSRVFRELDERAARLNISRQAVIKTLLERPLDSERAAKSRQKRKAVNLYRTAAEVVAPFAPAAGKPFGTIGSERIRIPAASKIALPTAGATPMIGVSPAPALVRSLRSNSTLSITGISENRGKR
jgi:hypothetical protein